MPDLRKDPIVGRWVIIASERGRRPQDFAISKEIVEPSFCPFCPGHEGMSPPEILSLKTAGGGWSVRVVPNKFPFFHIEGEFDRRPEGMYDVMQALGAHEIVVESPDHREHLATLEPSQIRNVLLAYRMRLDLRVRVVPSAIPQFLL